MVGEDATIHLSNAVTVLLWMGSGIDLAVLIVYSQFIRQIVLGRFLMTVRHKDRAPSCPSLNEKGTMSLNFISLVSTAISQVHLRKTQKKENQPDVQQTVK